MKEIQEEERKCIFPLDNPYKNLVVHADCYNQIKVYDLELQLKIMDYLKIYGENS